MSVTWLCPVCKRRVPLQVDECRCGTARPARPMAQPTALRSPVPQPRPVAVYPGSGFLSTNADWGWLILFAMLLVGAGVWAFLFRAPAAPPPLLGIVDQHTPAAASTPTPKAPPTARP